MQTGSESEDLIHIRKYRAYLQSEKNSSPLTVIAYLYDVRSMHKFLVDNNDGEPIKWKNVSPYDVRMWLQMLSDVKKMTHSTLHRKLQSIKSFFDYLQKHRVIKRSPAQESHMKQERRLTLPKIVRTEEIEAVLDPKLVDLTDFKQVRDHLVINLLYSLGLRSTELVCINDVDIDINGRKIRINGKRSRQRVLPLPKSLTQEISDYQHLRDTIHPGLRSDFTGYTPLLLHRNKRITQAIIKSIVKKALSNTTASQRSPHVLRHTFATDMLNGGADLNTVKEMLGHTSLSTTQIYTHLTTTDLMDNYLKAHPRAAGQKIEKKSTQE